MGEAGDVENVQTSGRRQDACATLAVGARTGLAFGRAVLATEVSVFINSGISALVFG
jgi:hypothetical protein